MRQRLQWILELLYRSRRRFVQLLTYSSMRLYPLKVRWEDVLRGSYTHRQHKDLDLERTEDLDRFCALSAECLQAAEARRTVITDKCNTLLTVTSLLLALFGLLLPGSLPFEGVWQQILFLAAMTGLVNAVVLLLTFFDVGWETGISIDQDDVQKRAVTLTRHLVNLRLRCQVDADNRSDYLVDIYKTARFFFLSSLLLACVLFLTNFTLQSNMDQSARILTKLRSDPDLVELLRGPKGERGDRGPVGAVELDRLVERLLSDKRFKELMTSGQDSTSDDKGARP